MNSYETPEEPGFFQRYKFALGGGVVAIGIAGYLIFSPSKESSVSKPVERPVIVPISLPPPPPPKRPTPPPQPTPPPREDKPEEKMVKQDTITEKIDKPEEKPVEAPQPAAAPMGTSIVGDGPSDGFGLAAGGGNGAIGGTGTGNRSGTIGGSRGGKFGWYASKIQTSLVEAFKTNPKTRTAQLQTEIRIWLDETGRITRVKLGTSSGDPALDSAIQNDVLLGYKFSDPPPEGMPMPIVMRFSARRPS